MKLHHYDKLYIGGEWVTPLDGESVETIDPATGKAWATVAFGGAKDIDRAIAAAREAFEGPWRRMPAWERAALLRKFADLYQKNAADLALLESRDTGRPIREARAELGMHHHWYHWFASLADKLDGRTIPMDSSVHAFTSRVPVGVVGAITPWNAPMLTTALKVGPALAAGCTIVLKPAEQTPVTALELAKIADEAGIPAGVINVVPAYGPSMGAHLVAHPGVDKISFTGEGGTAQKILQTGAANFKRFTFELGGKAPHIIFADADLENALNAATSSAWALCGQSCALGSRILVERPIYNAVVEEFARRAASVKVGMPFDESTHMGPQIDSRQLEKSLAYIESGLQEGATLVAGGKRLTGGGLESGYFISPTVFADVDNFMRIAREEIFGPVASIIPFDGEDEALRIANDTKFGLAAGLWTRDVGRAHRVADRINAGSVWVNTYRYVRWSLPYGGFKASGWGRENGIEALDSYLETKTTVISTTGRFPNPYAQ
jgi:aldehyde dehydrogenase (NAD+)